MTGPARTWHVGTNYSLSRTQLSSETKYLHSVTCVVCIANLKLNKCWKWWPLCLKKLWVIKIWKSSQISCARIPCFCRPGHIMITVLLLFCCLSKWLIKHSFYFCIVYIRMYFNGNIAKTNLCKLSLSDFCLAGQI